VLRLKTDALCHASTLTEFHFCLLELTYDLLDRMPLLRHPVFLFRFQIYYSTWTDLLWAGHNE
jgi:hypothetical protein